MSSFKQFKKNIQNSQLSRSHSRNSQKQENSEIKIIEPQNPNGVGRNSRGSRISYSREQQVNLDQLILSQKYVELFFDEKILHQRYADPKINNLQSEQFTIMNRTGTKVYYKISSNNPQLQIHPNQQILQNNRSISIQIKTKLPSNILTNSTSIQNILISLEKSFQKDKIEVLWGEITNNDVRYDKIPALDHGTQLPIKISKKNYQTKLNEQPKYTYYKLDQEYEQGQFSDRFANKMGSSEKILQNLDDNAYGGTNRLSTGLNYSQENGRKDKASNSQVIYDEKVNEKKYDYFNDGHNTSQRVQYEMDKNNASSRESSSGEQHGSLLTMPIMSGVAVISFLIGYMTA